MKSKYVEPNIKTASLLESELMAASPVNMAEEGTGNTETGGTSETGGDAHDRYSKTYSCWDEQED